MNDRTIRCQAAIADGRGGFSIESIEVAPPATGEVRIRLSAAGLCHTDVASLRWPGPLVMGHEGAGLIEAVGDGVANLKVGMPVVLNWAIPCGTCPQCTRSADALCDRTHETDPPRHGTSRAHMGATRLRDQPIERAFHLGTFAAYTVVRAEAATQLPAWLPPEQACVLGCAVMTGIGSAINVAMVRPGESVAIIGCGGVGLNVIQGARLANADRIIAIDRNPERFALARTMGATDTLVTGSDDGDPDRLVEAVRMLTDRQGVDHAFEATGRADLAFLPLRLARNGGTALQVSGSHGEAPVAMPDFFWSKRYIVPLYGGCVPDRDFPRLFDWIANGEIDLNRLISHEYALSDLGMAIEDMLSGRTTKAILRTDG